jgi:hypothetical protein
VQAYSHAYVCVRVYVYCQPSSLAPGSLSKSLFVTYSLTHPVIPNCAVQVHPQAFLSQSHIHTLYHCYTLTVLRRFTPKPSSHNYIYTLFITDTPQLCRAGSPPILPLTITYTHSLSLIHPNCAVQVHPQACGGPNCSRHHRSAWCEAHSEPQLRSAGNS